MDSEAKGYMFDTMIFNRALDGSFDPSNIKGTIYCTHIQYDELTATNDDDRRNGLLKAFNQIDPTNIATSSADWDVSAWDEANWTDEQSMINDLLIFLNESNNSHRNNTKDALIAETAIKNGFVLVSEEKNLRDCVVEYKGQAVSIEELGENNDKNK